MTEGQTHSTSSAWRERLVALRNVPPVLGILWESGRAVVTWGILLRIAVAALPAAIGCRCGMDTEWGPDLLQPQGTARSTSGGRW